MCTLAELRIISGMIKSWYRFLSPKFQNVFLDYRVDFKPRFGHGNKNQHKSLFDIVDANREEYAIWLNKFLKYRDVFHSFKSQENESDENLPAGLPTKNWTI